MTKQMHLGPDKSAIYLALYCTAERERTTIPDPLLSMCQGVEGNHEWYAYVSCANLQVIGLGDLSVTNREAMGIIFMDVPSGHVTRGMEILL